LVAVVPLTSCIAEYSDTKSAQTVNPSKTNIVPSIEPNRTKTKQPVKVSPTTSSSPFPTITRTSYLNIRNFTNAEMKLIGTRGNVACVSYPNISDLDGKPIEMNIQQGGKLIEKNVKAEKVGNEICSEMVDGKYVEGKPIQIEVVVAGENLTNSKQNFDLGPYKQVPFMVWIYQNHP
jgi:hypothetical protein